MIVLGIDPGLTGAVAALSNEWQLQTVVDLPTKDDPVNGRRIDCVRLADLLQKLIPAGESVRVCIEAMANGGQDRGRFSTVGSQFWTQSAIVATLELLGLEVEQFVPPQTWKKLYGLTGKKGEEAGLAMRKVRELVADLYPNLGQHVQRQKDHNRAEAILIAHWFRKVRG